MLLYASSLACSLGGELEYNKSSSFAKLTYLLCNTSLIATSIPQCLPVPVLHLTITRIVSTSPRTHITQPLPLSSSLPDVPIRPLRRLWHISVILVLPHHPLPRR